MEEIIFCVFVIGWLICLFFAGKRICSLYKICLGRTGVLQKHRYGIAVMLFGVLFIILEQRMLNGAFFLALFWGTLVGVAMHPGAKPWERCALVLSWGIGALCLALIVAYAALLFVVMIDKLDNGVHCFVADYEYVMLTPLREGLHVSGFGWSLVAILSYPCLVLHYLLSGRILARITGKPFRSLCGRNIIAIWSACAAIYVLFFVHAVCEEIGYSHVLGNLERHFGKPITFSTMAKDYFGGREPSPDYWRRLHYLTGRALDGGPVDLLLPDYYSRSPVKVLFLDKLPEEVLETWREDYRNHPEIAEIDAMLEGNIPPAPRVYPFPFFLDRLDFYDWRIARRCLINECWLLRLTMDEKRYQAAEAILARMEKICWYLRRDSLQEFTAAELIRLVAVRQYVETGHAGLAWLDGQITYLDNLEKDIPSIEKEEIYHSAVVFANGRHSLAHNLGESQAKGADLSKLRFFFPQAWWMEARSAKTFGRAFQCNSYSKMKDLRPHERGCFFNYADADILDTCVKTLLASVRGTRLLLEAERVGLCTGAYPEKMENVPLDPFTGRPLQYALGSFDVSVSSFLSLEEANLQCPLSMFEEAKEIEDSDDSVILDSKGIIDDYSEGSVESGNDRDDKYVLCCGINQTVYAMRVSSPGPDANNQGAIQLFIRLNNETTE